MSLTWRVYRRLARAFPHEFKVAYGMEVEQLGEDVIEEVARREGAAGLVRLLADIAIRVPIEYLAEMRGDMRYAVRAMGKSRGFAMVGIVSMGLAIGLATNVYSTKWALLFRDLPGAANAKRLAMPEGASDGVPKAVSYYDVEQYRVQKDLFAGAAAFQVGVPFNVTFQGNLKGRPQRIFGQLVSPDYFAVLGVGAQRGRLLSAERDKAGDATGVVVTDRFWRNRLNASPEAIGQALDLNGQMATIVGIAPKDFEGALAVRPAELFVPTTAPAAMAPELSNDVLHDRNAKEFLALLWLAPGVSFEQAEAGLDTVTRRLEQESGLTAAARDKSRRVKLLQAGTRVPLPRELKGVLAAFFIALMGLVLGLACINLANMLIARTASRRKELAIRMAIGASRFRLMRQMVAEGIALALMGGVAGIGIAYALGQLSSHFTPPTVVPTQFNVELDWRAVGFAFAIAILCGIGFSVAPALQATKADIAPALKEGSALRLPVYRRFGLRNFLMTGQVAASLMLLLLTGFLVIGIGRAKAIETKFDAKTMQMVSLDPVRDGYPPEKAQVLFERLPGRLKAVAGVQEVVMAAQPPFSDPEDNTKQVSTLGADGAPRVQQPIAEQTVGAGYFAALGEAMVAGREFEERDTKSGNDASKSAASPPVLAAVLNETAARRLFGNGSAVGQRVTDDEHAYEVVGVVGDVKDADGALLATMYLPLTARDFARPPAGGITLLVRSEGGRDARDAMRAIRKEIAFLDPSLNVFGEQTLGDYLERSRAATRFSVQTWGGIGLFGLVLAAIGLAGVTAYSVAQRRKEIAIRMAVGASRAQVLRLVLREGTALVMTGTVLGFVGATILARVLASLANVFVDALGLGRNDPWLLVGAPLLLAAVTLVACYIPARRSTKIDPLVALREE
jgi:macrolide transport system ATP-binding/permease protein